MEGKQKELKALDTIFYDLAARLICEDEPDRARARDKAKDRLHTGAKTAAHYVLLGVSALAAGATPAFGGIMPFGCALICAYDELIPLTTLFCCIGAVLRAEVILPVVYLLLMCARMITRSWQGGESIRLRALEAGGAMALYGVLYIITEGFGARTFCIAVAGCAAGAVAAVCLFALLDRTYRFSALYESGIYLTVYAVSCALCTFRTASLAPSHLLGFIAVAYLSRKGGGARGCVAGLAWGLGAAGNYAPAYALAGFICGRASNTMLGVGGGAIICMIYAAFTGGFSAVHGFLPEIALGAAVYAPLGKYGLLPDIEPFGEYYEQNEELDRAEYEKQAAVGTGQRLDAVSQALHSLSAIFYGMSERMEDAGGYDPREDITGVFARDYDMMADLIRSALSDNDDSGEDRALADKCRSALRATNFRCSTVTVIGGRRKTLIAHGVSRASLAVDAQAISRRLSNLTGLRFGMPDFTVGAERGTMRISTVPQLHATFSGVSTRKRGEQVSGDAFSSFISRDDRFYAILCDGMGSGKDAAIAARTCCVFLEKMLEGGNDPNIALEMLNAFLRGKGYECFATVDLLCIDLHTGAAFFIKGGGAPSYLIRSGNVYTVSTASAPVGIIRELHAQRISLELRPDDRIIMVSDGVADDDSPLSHECINCTQEQTFSEQPRVLQQSEREGTRECAERILRYAASGRGGNDDATVCCIDLVKL